MRTLLFSVFLAVAALDANAATYLLLSQTNSLAAGITNIAKVYSDSLTNGTVASATNLAKAYTDAHSATPMVGTVSNAVASAGLLSVDASKTNGIAATAAHVVSALGFTPANSNNVPSLIVGTVSNAVASAGLLAVDSTKTNGIAATPAHIVSTLGFTPANSNSVPTLIPGTVVNTVSPFGGGVPLVFAGTDATNAIPGYGGRPVTYVAGSHTISYTNNGTLLRHNDATNSFETFNDGATNGFAITIKNLGAGSVILTNTASKTFDGLPSISLLTGVILDVRADGTNYITDQISPKTITTGNTFFASPSDGSSGVPAMRAIVAADVAASIVTSQQTNITLANPTGTIGLSAVNGTALTVPRSDSAPALSQAIIPTWTGLHTFQSGAAVTELLLGASGISRGTLSMIGTNVVIDFSQTNRFVSCTLTGTVANIVVTNAAAVKRYSVHFRMPSSNVTPNFPFVPASSITNWLGGAPSTLTANAVGDMIFEAQDSTTNSTTVVYVESQ